MVYTGHAQPVIIFVELVVIFAVCELCFREIRCTFSNRFLEDHNKFDFFILIKFDKLSETVVFSQVQGGRKLLQYMGTITCSCFVLIPIAKKVPIE